LAWYDRHGRHDLPWKQDPSPYRVWVSEVMLQQTQVATVLPYYQRFMTRFPSLGGLAAADLDRVLELWSGLGYYARARNLHRAAVRVVAEHGGDMPADAETLQALPGIGRSTAAAIMALAHNRRHAILDGNVKRVLSRVHAVPGWPGRTAVSRQLWQISEAVTPAERVADYTQAIMDLGAGPCRRTRPLCGDCPLTALCKARAAGNPEAYPGRRPKRDLPVRALNFLLIRDGSRVLLQQRPPVGLWGALWSFPECRLDQAPEQWCREHLGLEVEHRYTGEALRHSFSHFHLDITPWEGEVKNPSPVVMEAGASVWYKLGQAPPGGLAAPIALLLSRMVS
jgi:A/G-specific adenine glycosylase